MQHLLPEGLAALAAAAFQACLPFPLMENAQSDEFLERCVITADNCRQDVRFGPLVNPLAGPLAW